MAASAPPPPDKLEGGGGPAPPPAPPSTGRKQGKAGERAEGTGAGEADDSGLRREDWRAGEVAVLRLRAPKGGETRAKRMRG